MYKCHTAIQLRHPRSESALGGPLDLDLRGLPCPPGGRDNYHMHVYITTPGNAEFFLGLTSSQTCGVHPVSHIQQLAHNSMTRSVYFLLKI